MRQRLAGIMTLLSLLMCVATLWLSLLSIWRFDSLRMACGRAVTLISVGGGVEIIWMSRYELKPLGPTDPYTATFDQVSTGKLIAEERSVHHQALQTWYGWQNSRRFFAGRYSNASGDYVGHTGWTKSYHLAFPHWVLVLVLAIAPTRAGIRLIKRRRAKAGCCARCGYDLRASRDRCPECGSPIPTEAIADGAI